MWIAGFLSFVVLSVLGAAYDLCFFEKEKAAEVWQFEKML